MQQYVYYPKRKSITTIGYPSATKLCAIPFPAMARSELAKQRADEFPGSTYQDAEFFVKTILEAITDCLAQGGRIEIRGFGNFSVHTRPPKLGRNPKTGEKVSVPGKRVPLFEPVFQGLFSLPRFGCLCG